MNRLNQIVGYTYASPRFHTIKFARSPFASEDYQEYDALNGTYDKFWPLYALTESDPPKSILINAAGTEVEIKGDLALFEYKDNYAPKSIGAVGYLNPTVNTNLDKVDYSFRLWLQPYLNPGWTNIQTYGNSTTSYAGFIIRLLSTAEIIKENHTVKLERARDDNSEIASSANFPTGIIVEYQNKLYRCVNPNNRYPSENNPDWLSLDQVNTVFNADFYVFNSSGTTVYYSGFSDRERTFDPKINNSNLVAWNLSAWYE